MSARPQLPPGLPTPTWADEDFGVALYCGDSLEIVPTLPESSIALIATDPPYFRVKSDAWDRQWAKADEFIGWLSGVSCQWSRVLKANGSLYCFASPQMAARVEVASGRRFAVLGHVRWMKAADNASRRHVAQLVEKGLARSWFPAGEEIIFAEHFGADNAAKGEAGWVAKCDELRGFVFEPLRAYLAAEWKRGGFKNGDANAACGTASMAARHYFSRSQWCLPTAEHYASLQRYANEHGTPSGDYLRREYEDLRREYEDLRCEYEDLRRPFTVTADVPFADVWEFPTVQSYKGKHPCEKPLAMMEHIIRTSSRPGDVVFDGFMGGGTTGVAAVNLGRTFIGSERERKWFDAARDRIRAAVADPHGGPMFADHKPAKQNLFTEDAASA